MSICEECEWSEGEAMRWEEEEVVVVDGGAGELEDMVKEGMFCSGFKEGCCVAGGTVAPAR